MKYKSQLISGACIAALALCAPLTASAQGKKSASPAPAASASAATEASPAATAKMPRALPFHGKISAVDEKEKTFTMTGKESSRVFKITDKTVLTKEGEPATMADVKADEDVRGSYWKHEDGSLEAKSVKLGAKTDEEKAKSSKKSKKSKKSSDASEEEPAASPKS